MPPFDEDTGNYLTQLLTSTGNMSPSYMQPSAPRQTYAPPMQQGPWQPGREAQSLDDIQRKAYYEAGVPVGANGQPQGQKRTSLVNILGGFADTFAELGGSKPMYQPSLDAATERRRQAEGDQMVRDKFGLDKQKYGLDVRKTESDLLNDQNERLGQVAGVLRRAQASGNPELVRNIWGRLRNQMGLTNEQLAQADQEVATNPEAFVSAMEAFAGQGGANEFGIGAPVKLINRQTGETILLQPSKAGGFRQEAIPAGFEIAEPLQFVDQGTQTGVYNRQTAQPVAPPLPMSGSPETGYTQQTTPGGQGTGQFAPAPGSKAAQEAAAEARKVAAEAEAAKKRIADTRAQGIIALKDVDDARRLAKENWSATGLPGQVTSMVGSTPARDLQAKAASIKARLGFAQLQAMREASPTGAGMGNVSNFEGELLQATIANLDQAQSEDQVLQALDTIARETTRIVHGPSVKYMATEDEYKALPVGSMYVSPDGQLREKKR